MASLWFLCKKEFTNLKNHAIIFWLADNARVAANTQRQATPAIPGCEAKPILVKEDTNEHKGKESRDYRFLRKNTE